MLGYWRTPLNADLLVADVLDISGLVLHELQVAIEYEALSYCWGDPTFDRYMNINGCRHAITSHLHQGLSMLRHSDKSRCLWIDLLCINQADDNEKSAQVARMFSTFRRARQVVVWLGGAYDQPKPGAGGDRLPQILVNGHQLHEVVLVTQLERLDIDFADEDLLEQGLRDLICRAWVRRVWVQQELFAARKVVVQCGPATASFAALQDRAKKLARIITQRDRPSLADGNALIYCETLEQMRAPESIERMLLLEADRSEHRVGVRCTEWLSSAGAVYSDYQPSQALLNYNLTETTEVPGGTVKPVTALECVLALSSALEATDVRDRIYALLSLSTCPTTHGSTSRSEEEALRSTIEIDYSRSPSRVFQDVTKYILNRDRTLQILRYHIGHSHLEAGLDLPSRTPDWRASFHHTHDPSFNCLNYTDGLELA